MQLSCEVIFEDPPLAPLAPVNHGLPHRDKQPREFRFVDFGEIAGCSRIIVATHIRRVADVTQQIWYRVRVVLLHASRRRESLQLRLVALPLASAACAGSGGLQYSVDLPALRVAFRDEGIRAIIWCSPHNPTGRVWRLAELGAVAALCQVVDVLALQPVRPIVKHNERCGLKC